MISKAAAAMGLLFLAGSCNYKPGEARFVVIGFTNKTPSNGMEAQFTIIRSVEDESRPA